MYGTDQQNRGARRDARAVVLAMRPDIRPLPRSVPVRGTRCCPALQSPPLGQKRGCQGPRICEQSCHKSACSVLGQNQGRRIKRMVFFVTHESAYIVTVDITTHVHYIRIHPAAPPKFWTSSYIGHPGSGHHVDDTPPNISQTLEKGPESRPAVCDTDSPDSHGHLVGSLRIFRSHGQSGRVPVCSRIHTAQPARNGA